MVMVSFIFVILILTPSDVLLCSIFNVSGCGIGTLETGVGAIVSVGVAVVDARAFPWFSRTTPGILSVCSTLEVFQFPPHSKSLFRSFWLSSRDEMSLTWSEASSKESWTMVSVSVETVARFSGVDISRLDKASRVSDWCSAVGLKVSTTLAWGNFFPVVRRKFAFHSRCAFVKCTLKVFQSRPRGGF